jgi:hypothetical protein
LANYARIKEKEGYSMAVKILLPNIKVDELPRADIKVTYLEKFYIAEVKSKRKSASIQEEFEKTFNLEKKRVNQR